MSGSSELTNKGGVLVSDFDGTMTRHDFAAIRASEAEVWAVVEQMGLDPQLPSAMDLLPEVEGLLANDPYLERCFRA